MADLSVNAIIMYWVGLTMIIEFGEFDPTFIFSLAGFVVGMVIGAYLCYVLLNRFLEDYSVEESRQRKRRQKIWDDFRTHHNFTYANSCDKLDVPIEQIHLLNQLIQNNADDQAVDMFRSKTFAATISKCEDDLNHLKWGIQSFHYDVEKMFLDIEEVYDLAHDDSPLDNAYPQRSESAEATK